MQIITFSLGYYPGMPSKMLLLDATGLIFRAYYSISPLTSPDGKPVNAVFGLLRMILKLFREVEANSCAFVFDAGSKTFRNDMFPDYKANRPPPPDDLRPQFAMSIEAARATGAQVFVEPGFEADDLIATLAKQAVSQGQEVTILTGDKDILQLVAPQVSVLLPAKRGEFTRYGVAEFVGRYEFGVERFVDFKALMGDPSDNIPGIPGVGEKTAAKLVKAYGKLEQIYANLDIIKPPKLQQKLITAKKDVYLYRDLVTLKDDCEVNYDYAKRKLPNFASAELASLISEMGFNRLGQDALAFGDLEASR